MTDTRDLSCRLSQVCDAGSVKYLMQAQSTM